jgi:hypothetical protein
VQQEILAFDLLYLALFSAATLLCLAAQRSFWKTVQFISPVFVLLGSLVYFFDNKEFGIHFTYSLTRLPYQVIRIGPLYIQTYALFTNEAIVVYGAMAFVLATLVRQLSARGKIISGLRSSSSAP